MTLRLHDTLTRRVEPFAPAEAGHVRMYTCGPTVYERAHIGNFRAFTWEDLLRRCLKWKGYRVTQVMNLTDVDDRTIRAASERGVSLAEVTEPVTEAFFEDWETLGLEPVEENPRATRHVPQMIELVRRLEAGGYTYESDGSVYFAIDRFPGYGRLANIEPESLQSSGRVEGDENYSKENPRDFVLWKGGERADEERVAVWDSPWGPGRPGWHLECSAMAMEYLGETLDIHTGGVDNIFPHHVNEIAQSEAATGQPFSHWWLHVEHLLSEGEKMSKSLGNYHTIESLVGQGFRPSAIRYLLLSAHYRSQLNFTLEGLRDAGRAVDRLFDFRRRVREARQAASVASPSQPFDESRGLEPLTARWREAFSVALDDDLNVSEALGATFVLVRDVNSALDGTAGAPPAGLDSVSEAIEDFDAVFGVLALREREEAEGAVGLEAWVEERLAARAAARAERDFARADAIRDEMAARGVSVEDGPSGTRWKLLSEAD
jgi:cysteinyl-tRNA synthetase